MDINHANILYVKNIHEIGGVETYAYEMVKKYKDLDIAVVCKTVAPKQRERLNKYCKVYIHKDQKINCKVIITNWDTSIIDYVNEDAKVYTVLHTDYSNLEERLGLPKDRPNITYIGITEDSMKKFEDLTGIHRTLLCRNPLEVEEEDHYLTLMSATRLTDIKDNGRHLKLAQALETEGIKFMWYIFTTDEYNDNPIWKDPNIIHMQNRLDLGEFMREADWYIQLSSCEGDSYSLKEALYRGTPIVVCELPYFKEIGIKNNENALFYNLNNSNAKEIAQKMKKPLKFSFNKIQDGYKDILAESKSYYEEEKNMESKVRCIKKYFDMQLQRRISENEEYIVARPRAEELEACNVVTILEDIKQEPIEEEVVKKPTSKKKKIKAE